MVALTIMAFIMVELYLTLNVTLSTRDMLEHEVRAARLGPQILDLIEADLRRVWAFNIEDDEVFKGERRTLLGESADNLVFLSSVDSTLVQRIGDRDATADVCETGYRLRLNPVLPDVLELWRRQTFHVDEEPLKEGAYERVYDRVVSLQFRYYEDQELETDPVEEWDASVSHSLPVMVRVILGIEVGPRLADERAQREFGTQWFERLIPLTKDAGLTMRVHPLPPTFVAAAGQAGGPNAAEGGDGEGGEGGPNGPNGGGGLDVDVTEGGGGLGDLGDFGGGGGGGGGGGNGGGGDLNDIFDDIFGGG